MAAFSTLIAAAGIAAGAAGAATQYIGQRKAQKGADRAEKLREAQSNIEAQRQNRQISRQALVARSTALSNATSQGAEGGSGLQGGFAQISNTAGSAMTAVNQNQGLGQGMFAPDRQISEGNSLASMGSGISSLGGALVQNSQTIGRIGNYFTRTPGFTPTA